MLDVSKGVRLVNTVVLWINCVVIHLIFLIAQRLPDYHQRGGFSFSGGH